MLLIFWVVVLICGLLGDKLLLCVLIMCGECLDFVVEYIVGFLEGKVGY